ncbi:Hypothetical protein PHPALM_14673 [Phytophthora palmivora]|uniref:Uncharacterized protein n=1 Tax=Phytophthora palmivora TaxID=4796 RepID=A0A2P4XU78_9STRA|nr:Hypothetical protein PHPALM_14673 [Phytophthora palmivora]
MRRAVAAKTSVGSGNKQIVIQKKVVDKPWDPDDEDAQEESDGEEGENQNGKDDENDEEDKEDVKNSARKETPAVKKRAIVNTTIADGKMNRKESARKLAKESRDAIAAAKKKAIAQQRQGEANKL